MIAALHMTAADYIEENHHRLTDHELAESLAQYGFGVSRNAVRKKRVRMGHYRGARGDNAVHLHESILPFVDHSLEVFEDNVLVLGDVEAPLHDAEWIERCVEVAQKLKIDKLILNGDFLHLETLSSFTAPWGYEPQESALTPREAQMLEDVAEIVSKKDEVKVRAILEKKGRRQKVLESVGEEIAEARKFVKSLRQYFDKAYWCMGNHEDRYLRKMEKSPYTSDLVRLLAADDWIDITPGHRWLTLISGDQKWRITHPRNTSVTPAMVARKLCSKHLCHVVQSHNHLYGLGFDVSGQYIGAEIGCCVDFRRLNYVQQTDSTRPTMKLGACIIRDGRITMLNPKATDWSLF